MNKNLYHNSPPKTSLCFSCVITLLLFCCLGFGQNDEIRQYSDDNAIAANFDRYNYSWGTSHYVESIPLMMPSMMLTCSGNPTSSGWNNVNTNITSLAATITGGCTSIASYTTGSAIYTNNYATKTVTGLPSSTVTVTTGYSGMGTRWISIWLAPEATSDFVFYVNNLSSGGTGTSVNTFTAPATFGTYIMRVLSCGGNGATACSAGNIGTYVDVKLILESNNTTTTAGAIGSAQTICTGGTPAMLTSTTNGTGTGTLTYEWQKDGVTIGGAVSATYSPTALAATAVYRRRTKVVNTCGTYYSGYTATVTITVVADPASGTLTPTPAVGPVCAGTNVSATSTAGSGGTGTITDVLQYRFDGGAWVAYTSGTNLSTTGRTSVDIQTYRTATGLGCGTSTAVVRSWTVNAVPAVTTVSGAGTYCGSTALTASGGAGGTIYWQNTISGGTSTADATNPKTVSATGTYYFRSYSGSCWGAEGSAAVTINAVPAVTTVSGAGTYCGSTSLTASGGAGGTIYWQNTTSGGTSTADVTNPKTVSSTGTYYFRSYSGSCWGAEGSAAVTINAIPAAPTGSASQSFCGTGTVTNLTATGTAIQWYAASSGGSPLAGGTALANGTHYYATQTVSGCESTARFDVTATVYTPATTSLTANDYIWNATSANWDASVNNWLQYNGSGFVVPGAIPSASTANIFFRGFSGCASAATVSSAISCNHLTIESGLTLNISGTNTLSVYGNFSKAGTFNAGTGTVSFNGSANQVINGNSFNNVTFNNTTSGSSDINISQPVSVTGTGTFTNGIVYFTGTGSLTFGSGASCNGGSASGFVNGPVTKTGTDAFTFPVGKVSGSEIWAPVGIAAPASSSVITAEYFYSSPGNVNTLCDPATFSVSSLEYWNLSSDVAYPAVTLHWKDASRSQVNTSYVSDIVVAHWEDCSGTPKWVYKNPTTGGAGGATGSVTSETALTSYSPFAFGTKTNNNPLPIELLSFEARCSNGKIDVEWSTASETNNSFFILEKATNEGKEPREMIFIPIGKINSRGNSSTIQNYSFADNTHLSKDKNKDGVNYYRLKQTDLNGAYSYSGIIYTTCYNSVFEKINVYPNPVSGRLNCDIFSKENIIVNISITDLSGRNVVLEKVNLSKGENHTSIDVSSLSPAPYFFKLEALEGNVKDCKQILVK